MDDQVSDVDPPTVTLLGSVLGRVGVDPDNGGGPSNVGMFARAALFGSVPRPNWEEVWGGGVLRLSRTSEMQCYPCLPFPVFYGMGRRPRKPPGRVNTTPPTWPRGVRAEILRRTPRG